MERKCYIKFDGYFAGQQDLVFRLFARIIWRDQQLKQGKYGQTLGHDDW